MNTETTIPVERSTFPTEWTGLASLIEPEPWVQQSLCAQSDPDIFFPEKGGSTLAAKQVCSECPVRAECLAYARRTDQRIGVWGGLSAAERKGRVTRRGPGADAITVEQIGRLTELVAEDLPNTVIAERLGATPWTVGYWRKQLGLPASSYGRKGSVA